MPQASQETVDEYFELFNLTEHDDAAGFEYLLANPNIKHHKGTFYYSNQDSNSFDAKTWAAMQYLCDEWDYATDYLENYPKGVNTNRS